MRAPRRSSQDRHERTCFWIGSYKILRQEPPKSIAASQTSFHTSTSKTWPLQNVHVHVSHGLFGGDLTRISTRAFDKDLHRIVQGPLREELIRISMRSSHKDLYKIMQGRTCARISPKSSQPLLTKIPTRPHSRSLFAKWAIQKCTIQLMQDSDRRDQERDKHFVRTCAIK